MRNTDVKSVAGESSKVRSAAEEACIALENIPESSTDYLNMNVRHCW